MRTFDGKRSFTLDLLLYHMYATDSLSFVHKYFTPFTLTYTHPYTRIYYTHFIYLLAEVLGISIYSRNAIQL